MATPESALSSRGRLREHLSDPLYRTGYYLILGTGVTSLLGVGFWALAAHSYSARVVGLNAAAISAMTLVAEACTLGLSAVLVRYLPVAGGSTRRLVSRSYMLTISLALISYAAWRLGARLRASWISANMNPVTAAPASTRLSVPPPRPSAKVSAMAPSAPTNPNAGIAAVV